MPQDFHVLRCFECETFQVHIVKKSKKWECKMCGAKQSLKKVYFSGPAKNCRLHVQSLNEHRIVTDSYQNYNNEEEIDNIQLLDPEQSKWNEFIQNESDNSENELDNCGMSFERQTKRSKYNKKEDNYNKKMKKNSFANEENVETQSKWNSFVPEIYEEHDNNSENLMEVTKNTKETKWNCFVRKENEEKLQETCEKQSKWDCFITKTHENNEKEEEENNFECDVKNISVFSQVQPADDSLDFLNLD